MTDPSEIRGKAKLRATGTAASRRHYNLRELLEAFTYPSSVDGLQRHLGDHHVDHLARYLARHRERLVALLSDPDQGAP